MFREKFLQLRVGADVYTLFGDSLEVSWTLTTLDTPWNVVQFSSRVAHVLSSRFGERGQ